MDPLHYRAVSPTTIEPLSNDVDKAGSSESVEIGALSGSPITVVTRASTPDGKTSEGKLSPTDFSKEPLPQPQLSEGRVSVAFKSLAKKEGDAAARASDKALTLEREARNTTGEASRLLTEAAVASKTAASYYKKAAECAGSKESANFHNAAEDSVEATALFVAAASASADHLLPELEREPLSKAYEN